MCAGSDFSSATCHMAAKCGGRDTSFNPCAGTIVLRPDKLAVMTRFQQISQRPRSHFGELSAASLQKGSGRAHELRKARTRKYAHMHQVRKNLCWRPRQARWRAFLWQLMHHGDQTTDHSSAGSSLNTLTGPAGVLIRAKVDIILSTNLTGNW